MDKTCGYDLLNPSRIEQMITKAQVPFSPEEHKALKETKQAVIADICNLFSKTCAGLDNATNESILHPICAVWSQIEHLLNVEELNAIDMEYKKAYSNLFPSDILYVSELPIDVLMSIKLRDAQKPMVACAYLCLRKYCESWGTLIEQHLAAGHIWLLTSKYVSPVFIVLKVDLLVLLRWVNDYWKLNVNMVLDNHPLLLVDDILKDCVAHNNYGKIDMTNTFFQTWMVPDSVKYTVVNTPLGLYEWLIMPMGLRNSPAVHQRCVFAALRPLISKICHVYLDDVIIWSNTIEEHKANVATILEALCAALLYCSIKKSQFFCIEINFLGHHISHRGY